MTGAEPRAVVLVEGTSDRIALETLAARRGRDLGAEGVSVLSMGGATNIARFLAVYGPPGLGVPVTGLCDVAEEGWFRRGLERAGLGAASSRAELAALGFFVCVPDLEGELIGALGSAAVEQVIAAQGDLASFRRLQRMPAQRGRDISDQLRRFMGTRSGRKNHYARVLVEALAPAAVPPPLDQVLARV